MEEKIEIRKDIVTKLIKGNLVLIGVKVGSILLPSLSIVGYLVPQAYVMSFLLLGLYTIVYFKKKEEKE